MIYRIYVPAAFVRKIREAGWSPIFDSEGKECLFQWWCGSDEYTVCGEELGSMVATGSTTGSMMDPFASAREIEHRVSQKIDQLVHQIKAKEDKK